MNLYDYGVGCLLNLDIQLKEESCYVSLNCFLSF